MTARQGHAPLTPREVTTLDTSRDHTPAAYGARTGTAEQVNGACLEVLERVESVARPNNLDVILLSAIVANPAAHWRYRRRASAQLDRIECERGTASATVRARHAARQ